MKKKDIIQLVKKIVKENTFYGNREQPSQLSTGTKVSVPTDEYPFSAKPKRTATGMMEDEDLKEFTAMGQEGIYPKREEPGDMFQQKEVEELLPNGIASRNDRAFQDRLKQHADWTEESGYNNTFVHIQYHNSFDRDHSYQIHQSQNYNGNYNDFRNPKFTVLHITKKKEGKEEKLGSYIVDTDAYLKDLAKLRNDGVLGDKVSENKKNKMKKIRREAVVVSKMTSKGDAADLAKSAKTTVDAVNTAIDSAKLTGDEVTVAEEGPSEGNAFGQAMQGAEKGDTVKVGDKEFTKNEHTISFTKDEMSQLHNTGKLVKADKEGKDHTYIFSEDSDHTPEPEMTNDIGKDKFVDDEGRHAKMQLQKAAEYSVKLAQMMDDMTQLPSWVQSKITKASDYMSAVYHYLDYEMTSSNENLMENINKHRKRARLMEGATEKLFKLFNAGKTDSEVRSHHLQLNIDMPEAFISKLRNNWEALRKTKLDLTLADKEAEGFESIQQSTPISGMDGGGEGMEEEKQLASGLFNENNNNKK